MDFYQVNKNTVNRPKHTNAVKQLIVLYNYLLIITNKNKFVRGTTIDTNLLDINSLKLFRNVNI